MNPGIISKYFSGINTFFSRFAEGILRWRWLLLILVLILTVFAFYEMRGLRMDNSNEAFFLKGDPSKLLLEKFRDTFGNEDFVYILFETDNFFKPENISLIKRLARDLEESVPYISDIKFLGNVEYIGGVKGGIEIIDLIEEIPRTSEEIELIKERAMNEPLYLDNLISRTGKTAAILLECEPYPEEKADPRKDIPPVVYKILDKPEYSDLEIYTVGGPVMDYEIDKIAAKEMILCGSFCILLLMVVMLGMSREWRGLFSPLLVVILSIFWTLGTVGALNWKLSMMVMMLPVLLICVGIGDSMHIISEFQDHKNQGHSRKEAIIKTLSMVGIPCLLTSLTTAAGFLSFQAALIKPIREMGIYAAIGVIMALILSLVIVPIVFSFGKNRSKNKDGSDHRNDLFDRMLGGIASFNIKHSWAIIVLFVFLSIISIFGYSLVQIETDFMKSISTDVPIREAYDYVDSRMGGSMSLEVMLDTGKKDGVKEIGFLKQMESLQNYIDSHPLTYKTTSVIDILKKMRRAMYENQMEYYSLPETSEQAAEYLFLYETSGGEELDRQVSFNYDAARIQTRSKTLSTKDVRSFISDVNSFVKTNMDPGIKVESTGTMTFVKAMADYVSQGQRKSFIWAFLAIAVMMIIALRSFKLGLISMIPNLFPVVISFGLMGLLGIYMSIPLMIFAPIVIGIAVDDTVHFFMRYIREFNQTGTYKEALKATLLTVGRPITFTTITLVIGFSVFVISDMHTQIQFGLLSAFAFLWALLADFFLAPAMILLLKPLGPERVASQYPM